MLIRLDGQVALVTGAAQGIGRAIAEALGSAGARVHLADIAPITGSIAADPSMPQHRCDLGSRDAVQSLVGQVLDESKRLDIVVNAAGGVCGQVGRDLTEVDEADWQALFRANVDSAFWLAQAAAVPMRAHRHGRLVFIASGAGLRPSLTGIQAYTAAKHALVGLTRQLSQDLGPDGITSNAIAPGFIRSNPTTERQWQAYSAEGQARLIASIHLRRLGQPEDIARAALFLASQEAGWISGQILAVDGGRS